MGRVYKIGVGESKQTKILKNAIFLYEVEHCPKMRRFTKLIQSPMAKNCNQVAMCSNSTRHFEEADHSALYAKVRPEPPESLIQSVLKFHHGTGNLNLATDLGCGSGQFTKLLAPHFSKVVASDVSKAMLEEGKKRNLGDHVTWLEGAAEEVVGVAKDEVDFISICQALHWTSPEPLFVQVGRCLRQGGCFAVVGYDFSRPHPDHPQASDLTAAMFSLYKATGAHWSARRRLVDERYSSIPAPAWARRSEKSEHMVVSESSLGAWADYIRSWSGFQHMSRQAGEEAAEELISTFLDTCRKSLDSPASSEPYKIPLQLATQYWVTVYQK